MFRRVTPPILALLLAACQGSAAPTANARPPISGANASSRPTAVPKVGTSPGAAASSAPTSLDANFQAPTIASITGTVTAPASLVAAGGLNLIGADGGSLVAAGAGNLVAAGAGNLVAAGAGNLVAAGPSRASLRSGAFLRPGDRGGNYALAQAAAPPGFKPVARARVYLTAGDAVLPIAPVETDDQGNYRFPKVPSGLTYQVVVSIITPAGKTGRLAALVQPDAKGAVADISPVTTMVCAAVVGTKTSLGHVDPASIKAATDTLGQLIAGQSGADIDLGNPGSLPGKVEALVASSSTAKDALATLKGAVEKDPRSLDEMAAMIKTLDFVTCAVADVVAAPTPNVPGDLPAAPSAIAVAGETIYLGDRERRRVVVLEAGAFDRAIDGVEPLALAVAGGALYVGDAGAGKLLRIAADGTRTDLAADQAYEPTAIAVAADGTVYFADGLRHAIYRVEAAGGPPTLLVGGKPGHADGAGAAARLYRPSGLALVGSSLYVADAGNRRIRRIDLAGLATIGAYAGSGAAGAVDGSGTAASFGYPAAIAADGQGTLWVADASAGTVRRITGAGAVETVLEGGCVLDAGGLTFTGGLTFAGTALYLLDGDRVVRRPVGPQPSPTPTGTPGPTASPAPLATQLPAPTPSATGTPII